MNKKLRDWFLQQMNIQQYQLRYSYVIKNEVVLLLKPHIRLILVSQHAPILQEPLFCDVLYTLNINLKHIMILIPEQLCLLPLRIDCAGWLMGIKSDYPFNGIILNTVIFSELICNSKAKRELWKQICNYKHYFK